MATCCATPCHKPGTWVACHNLLQKTGFDSDWDMANMELCMKVGSKSHTITHKVFGIYVGCWPTDFRERDLFQKKHQSSWLARLQRCFALCKAPFQFFQLVINVQVESSTTIGFPRWKSKSKWMFPKIVVPQILHFNRVFHYKPSILGYPYFWETSNFCSPTTQRGTGSFVRFGLRRAMARNNCAGPTSEARTPRSRLECTKLWFVGKL